MLVSACHCNICGTCRKTNCRKRSSLMHSTFGHAIATFAGHAESELPKAPIMQAGRQVACKPTAQRGMHSKAGDCKEQQKGQSEPTQTNKFITTVCDSAPALRPHWPSPMAQQASKHKQQQQQQPSKITKKSGSHCPALTKNCQKHMESDPTANAYEARDDKETQKLPKRSAGMSSKSTEYAGGKLAPASVESFCSRLC